jgi:amidase
MLMTITTYGAPGGREVISAHEWFNLVQPRAKVRREWRALFAEFDVVLAPVFGTTAFPLTDEPVWSKRSLLLDGEPTAFGDQLAWSGMATFAGLPATAAPIAESPDGLPIGVQIIGAFLHDRTTIALARQIEALRAG